MWTPDDIWKAYSQHFEVVESARAEWSVKALEFLNLVCKAVSDSPWAEKANLRMRKLDINKWGHSYNHEYLRPSDYFDLESKHHMFRIIIRFGTKPDDDRFYFLTRAECHLKRGKSVGRLLKAELDVVKQFVAEKNEDAVIIPGRPGSFYFKALDATSDDFNVDQAVSAVEQTLICLRELRDPLIATH
jgi:hypothetical protein